MYFTFMEHKIEFVNLADDTLHHCSSIVAIPQFGRIVAAYLGPECEDQQHVFITSLDTPCLNIHLQAKTGNPLLWYDESHNCIYLIYSLYEDEDALGNKPRNPVQRWMYCSTWMARLDLNKFQLVDVHRVDDAFGLLARCAPYRVNGRNLIPLYREKDPRCEIWEVKNGTLARVSVFGDITETEHNFAPSNLGNGIAIQPTLIKQVDTLYAFCRNVCRDAEKAWVFSSIDDGATWSEPKISSFPNHNNSLTAIPWENVYLMMLSNDKYRSEMFLSGLDNSLRLGVPLADRRSTFSYPNYCVDSSMSLHMVHSNAGVIAVHKMDSEFVDFTMINKTRKRPSKK